jgi:hypothetical protein
MKWFLPGLMTPLLILPINKTFAQTDELAVYSVYAPNAPMDPKHEDHSDAPLSKRQRKVLLGEFKGLVHLGLRKTTYSQWEGKDMGDCMHAENSTEHWTQKCIIQTAQGEGTYYFFSSDSQQSANLQDIDIHIDAASAKLLDDFRGPVEDYFGKSSLVERPFVQAKTSGPIHHWDVENTVVELFMDCSTRPEGSVRFIWVRSPQIKR